MLMVPCSRERRENSPSQTGAKNNYSVINKESLYRLFTDVIGLPLRVSKPIIETFYKWLGNYGPEWTVERLKNLKTQYLQLYAGNTSFRIEDSCLGFHRDGTPRGVFHALWTMGNSYRTADKCLRVLLLYTTIVIKGNPTRKQRKKFLQAVLEPRPQGVLDPWYVPDKWGKRLYAKAWELATFDKAHSWINSDKNVTHLDPMKGFRRIPEFNLPLDEHVADLLLLSHTLLEHPETRKLFYYVFGYDAILKYQDILARSKALLSETALLDLLRSEGKTVGHIGLIQERGCKLRAVANPLRAIQIALSRLKNMLEIAAQSLPWDCTFDQEKGIRWAQERLSKGDTLSAFDLSNASDTIPLRDETDLLAHVGDYIDDWQFWASMRLFYKVSRSKWIAPKTFPCQDFLTWSKGQGLGIGCSFGAFAQAHGHRLNLIQMRKGLANQFVVLGDDVIVTSAIAAEYEEMVVNGWGCDISASKTITSEILSEFASRVVTRNYKFNTYKYPQHVRLFDPKDPIGLFTKFGKKALKVVPSRYKQTVQLITGLPKPVGLGWKWPDADLLLPDPKASVDCLMPVKREALVDVLPVKRVRRKGGRHKRGAAYDSVVVSSKSYVERKQDLLVAFQGNRSRRLSIEIGLVESKRQVPPLFMGSEVSLLEHIGEPVLDKPISGHSDLRSLVLIQDKILHVNANRDNDSPIMEAFAKAIGIQKLTGRNRLKSYNTQASVLTMWNDPVSLFERKIEHWGRSLIFWGFLIIPFAIDRSLFLMPRYDALNYELKLSVDHKKLDS